MAKIEFMKGALAALALATAASAADAATYTYVGSWQVDQGPDWWNAPVAYTGQEAAALIFGGSAADYVLSTVSALAADINFQNWVSIYGVWGGSVVAQDYEVSQGGNYVTWGDTSAYIWDNAQGATYTNYAFQVAAVPLPAGGLLLLAGLGGLAAARRRKSV